MCLSLPKHLEHIENVSELMVVGVIQEEDVVNRDSKKKKKKLKSDEMNLTDLKTIVRTKKKLY